VRTFIAIPIPEKIKQYADRVRKELNTGKPDVKWVEYANYHLTLKFLGDIDLQLNQNIREKMYLIGESCPSFEFNIKGLGFFPNKTRPRVIWLGIEGEMDKADFLGERIDSYLCPLGFEPEKRRSFHLTIGRVRSDSGLDELVEKAAAINKENSTPPFRVKTFNLMESKLSPGGPRYEVIETFVLNG
jgi:2'-5' RNA ligase